MSGLSQPVTVLRDCSSFANLRVCTPRPASYIWFYVFTHDHFGFIYCAGGRSRTYNFNHHWHQITKRGSIQPSSTFLSLSCLIFVLPHCCRFFAGKDLLSFSVKYGTFPHYHKPSVHLHTRVYSINITLYHNPCVESSWLSLQRHCLTLSE